MKKKGSPVVELKQRLIQGKVVLGSWITIGHPSIPEIMQPAGFEWLAVDMEHSAITLSEAQKLIQVIDLLGIVPLVRVTSNDGHLIKRVMDAGAQGIIVPMVNSPEEARAAVNAVYYPPRGGRGVGLARAQGYGLKFSEYLHRMKHGFFVAVQIEHIEAVRSLDKILDVPGVDAFLVGPYDLSASLGVPGEFDHPSVRQAMRHVIKTAQAKGVPAGFHVISPSSTEVARRRLEGYRFLAVSLDSLFLGESCGRVMRSCLGKR